jgi:hypothetical protein
MDRTAAGITVQSYLYGWNILDKTIATTTVVLVHRMEDRVLA